MIPACQHMAQKLDKLTVLRKAVQHLKALKGNSATAPPDGSCPPPTPPPAEALCVCDCSWKRQRLCTHQPQAFHPPQRRAQAAPAQGGQPPPPILDPPVFNLPVCLQAADGFLLVVSCDRAKILFISESVSEILNFSPVGDARAGSDALLLL